MKHVFYEKMPHSASKWDFSDKSHNPKDVDWCVTEKCHGANFSFLCDGNTVNHARRNDILQEKEKFFGYKTMAEKYKENVLNAYNLILNNEELMDKYVSVHNDEIKNIKYGIGQVSVYGEMFGGFFPQQNKSKTGKVKKAVINNRKDNNNTSTQNNDNNAPNNPNQTKRRNRRRRRRGKRGGKKNNNNADNDNGNNKHQNNKDNDGWITKGQGAKHESEEKKSDTNTQEKNYVVQREILYCPYIEFYAFDIAITLNVSKPETGNKRNRRRKKKKQLQNANNDNDNDDGDDNKNENSLEIRCYMDYCDAMEIFKACKFFYAKPLLIGTFEDCCKYNYEFKSTIPNALGLQPLHKRYGDNLAEGVIVKPMKNVFYTLGDDKQLRRAIVKLKHPFFQERIGDFKRKFRDNEAQKNKNNDKDKDPMNIAMILEMMNVNRYQSVISKHGNPEKDNYDFYVNKMVQDIYEDIVNIDENGINEWWENRILKREQLLKYVEMKLQKKAMEIITNQN